MVARHPGSGTLSNGCVTVGPLPDMAPCGYAKRQGDTVTKDPETAFRALYVEHFSPLLGYALRRVTAPEDAADVVAETFLVAWRRSGEVPAGPEARLWLYGVARRVLANHSRGERRRHRLGSRLQERLRGSVPDHAPTVVADVAVAAALARLSRTDQEVLTLSAWEGLEPREVAEVLGMSAGAVRTRLSRARERLRKELGEPIGNDQEVAGHVLGEATSVPRRGNDSRA
jgi:RNA polymerase sigma factor (sigma-70 family)